MLDKRILLMQIAAASPVSFNKDIGLKSKELNLTLELLY